MNIRAARTTEASRLTEIARAAKRHWGYDERLMGLWADELSVSPGFITTHPVFCAVDGEGVAGFYALSGNGDTYELEHMWVDPKRIGTGVGSMLFAHAVETVAGLGGSVINVASDPNAEGFYLRMGARPVGRVPSTPEGRTLPLLAFTIERK